MWNLKNKLKGDNKMDIEGIKEVLKGINTGVITEEEALKEIKKANPTESGKFLCGELIEEGII